MSKHLELCTILTVCVAILHASAGCGGNATVEVAESPDVVSPSSGTQENPTTSATDAIQPAPAETEPAAEDAAASPPNPEPNPEPNAAPASGSSDPNPPAATAEIAAPATSAQAKQRMDLRKLPRLEIKQVMQEDATYVYYAARSTVSAAEAYYQALLEKEGWKKLPQNYPGSDEYSDHTYENDGFHLRVSIGESSEEGQVGINLSNLGNANLMQLPRLDNVALHEGSQPYNSNYRIQRSIKDVVDFCRTEFAKIGWTECQNGLGSPGSVPHYASVSFVNQALRLDVSISKDPRNASSPTLVAYMAQPVLTHDLPLLEPNGVVTIDFLSGKSMYDSNASVEQLVEFYRNPTRELGWTYREEGSNVNDRSATLMIEDEPELGFALSIHPHEGLVRVQQHILSFREPESPAEPPAPSTTDLAENRSQPEPDLSDVINQVPDDVEALLRAELEKVGKELGDLGGLNLEGLLSDSEPEAEMPKETAENVEQEVATEAADPSIDRARGVVQLGEESFSFQHGAAFQAREFDEPVTVIMMCDKAIPRDRLAALLGKEERPGFFELYRFEIPNSIEIVLNEDFVNVNCYVDGTSVSLGSNDTMNDTKISKGRISGKVAQTEPRDVFDKPFKFEMEFDLALLTSKDAPPNPNPGQLMVDSTYEELVPDGTTSFGREASQYRSVVLATIDEEPKKVLEFYLREMKKRGSSVETDESTPNRAVFTSEEGTLLLDVTRESGETLITLTKRNEAKAREDDMVPPAGKTRFILGNASEQAIVITLNGRQHKVDAGVGEENPVDAMRVDVEPGEHKFTIKMNGKTEGETLNVEAGSTWGIIAIPEIGYFAEQLY